MNPNEQDTPEPQLPSYYPLRDGLRLHPRDDETGQITLEDTERGKYFRLGPDETRFVRALIETQSAIEAHDQTKNAEVDESTLMENRIRLCKWLAVNSLVHETNPAYSAQGPAPARPGLLSSAFFWRVRLLNPDRLLECFVSSFGWLFSPLAMAVGLVIFVASLLQTTGRWPEFMDSYQNLFSSYRWLVLAVGWFGLKVLHELAHGATCRRYGGEVREAGLAMILMMPIAYVNVTSSWRFPSRWQRLHVTLAGVVLELFIAGCALICWNVTDSMPVQQAAADIVLLASVSSLLFNLNPLLKFDGYFALADATGIDNLYSYAQRYARYFGGRYVLGLDPTEPQLPGRYPTWIKIYAVMAACYRVVTVSGLIVGAAALFHGAGIILAFGGAIGFVVKPVCSLVAHLGKIQESGALSRKRLFIRLACLSCAAIAPLWIIPAKWSWTAPAIVEYDPPCVIRNRPAGFVESVLVVDGQTVEANQPLIVLRNDSLQLRLEKLKMELAQVRQETLAARWQRLSPELNDALSTESSLEKQLDELRADVDGLIVRASSPGTVVSRKFKVLPGRYLEPGQELAVVGNEVAKRLRVSMSQSDAKESENWTSDPVRVFVEGQSSWKARLARLESRASLSPPDPSLIATNGGPLAAIQVETDEFSLCEPRVNGFVPLSPEKSEPLRCGQRAYVRLGRNRSLGSVLVDYCKDQLALRLFY